MRQDTDQNKALMEKMCRDFLEIVVNIASEPSISSVCLGSEVKNQWRMWLHIFWEVSWKGQQWNHFQNQIAIEFRDTDNLLILQLQKSR